MSSGKSFLVADMRLQSKPHSELQIPPGARLVYERDRVSFATDQNTRLCRTHFLITAIMSSQASGTHYSFACLPALFYADSTAEPGYRFAYTRPVDAAALSKETVWRVTSHFKDYLQRGQRTFSLVRSIHHRISGGPAGLGDAFALVAWKQLMTRQASANKMDGQSLTLEASGGQAEISFRFTLHDTVSHFERPPAPGQLRTETWRMFQIQSPWAPVLVATLFTELTPSGQSFSRGIPIIQSHFYSPRNEASVLARILLDASRDSPSMREHREVCTSCRGTGSHAICHLAEDDMASSSGTSIGHNTVAVPHSLVQRIGHSQFVGESVNRVVNRLRSSYEPMRTLNYEIYTSAGVYNAGLDWMGLSIDETPRTS